MGADPASLPKGMKRVMSWSWRSRQVCPVHKRTFIERLGFPD